MNKIIRNTLILTAITLVSGLLLGFVHELTAAGSACEGKRICGGFPGSRDLYGN